MVFFQGIMIWIYPKYYFDVFLYQYFIDDLVFSNSPPDTYYLAKLLSKILSKRSWIEQKCFCATSGYLI